jgi:hypothetical protein
MIFLGLQGTIDWAVQVPNSIGAKVTNASPGIAFATVGLIIGILVVARPVEYETPFEDRDNPLRRFSTKGMEE